MNSNVYRDFKCGALFMILPEGNHIEVKEWLLKNKSGKVIKRKFETQRIGPDGRVLYSTFAFKYVKDRKTGRCKPVYIKKGTGN